MIIDTFWFSGLETIGIVVIENPTGERKAYVGKANGFNEGADKQKIMNNGSKMYVEQLEQIVKLLKKE